MLKNFKKLISLDNPFRLLYHKIRAIIANIMYGFPSKNMTIVWVTWTNWKTTTCNIIAQWLIESGKKVFMFSTVNIIIWKENYVNTTKMTSPDAFELQRLLKIAKSEWCEIAIIETASHWIKMNRIWWIHYDILVLTNITQDHLDLHWTMKDYVNTKLKIFKNLITYNRKKWVKKTAIINIESKYSDLFLAEIYDWLFTYWFSDNANIKAFDIKNNLEWVNFSINITWTIINVDTKLRWDYNIENILWAIWVLVSFWIKPEEIKEIIKKVSWIPGRMEEIINAEWYKIFIDYAHTPDALEKILENLKEIPDWKRIITVFWATWDRDKTKRPKMWEIVSKYSEVVILTQDDDYSEKTENIIKDILPWIERKEWENFWIITDREEAIRNALIIAEKWDIILIAWKWDEHTMVTNEWTIEWHDKTIVNKILKQIEDNKIIK